MTGFGIAEEEWNGKKIAIEIRSLNGKMTDVRMKLPAHYKELELPVRKYILEKLGRGKIEVNLSVDGLGDEEFQFNEALFIRYYNEISGLVARLEAKDNNLIASILRLPNVFKPSDPGLGEPEKEIIWRVVKSAVAQLNVFRKEEGLSLEEDMRLRIRDILFALEEVKDYEKERIEHLKNKLNQNLRDYLSNDDIDENRFEQEVLYYLEKLDINEEKVRLKQHCTFFLDQLDSPVTLKGKKLGFISQEIGREINTMGSKAQHSAIQRCVVRMKDELEKIKEQIANAV